jgi:hypothetical protein
VADPGLTAKDIVMAVLAGSGLLVTIVWNLQNRWHTDRTARQIRADAFAFDEWKSHRTEILQALRTLEASSSRLIILAKGAHKRDALLEEITKEGLKLAEAHLGLLREMERARHVPDWGPLAYGKVDAQGESDWDRLNTILAEYPCFSRRTRFEVSCRTSRL